MSLMVLGLLASVEGGGAVGVVGGGPCGVVGSVVVPGAQGGGVVEVGWSAVGPGFLVVGLGVGGGDGAVDLGAGLVAYGQGEVLVVVVEAFLAALVEDHGRAAQDHREQSGVAG